MAAEPDSASGRASTRMRCRLASATGEAVSAPLAISAWKVDTGISVLPPPASRMRRMASIESISASTLSALPKAASCSSMTLRRPTVMTMGVRASSASDSGRAVPRVEGGEITSSGSEMSGVSTSAGERGGLVMMARSSRPVSRASSSCGLKPSITLSVTVGHCWRARAMQPGSSSGARVGEVPMTTRPRGIFALPRTCSLARATSRMMRRACSRKSRPEVVRRTPRGRRISNCVPSSASSCLTWRVRAGCATPSLPAVRVMLPSSAICTKYWMLRSSMRPFARVVDSR